MDWHIITSSKGGIGKTLLTLLLLAYHLENKRDGSALVLDLNGMNTDSASLLLYKKTIGEPATTLSLKTTVPLYHSEEVKQIKIQRTYSMDNEGERIHYAVAYPLNPYGLYNPQLFADLLTTLKEQAPNIQHDLQLDDPFKYIFIDTNYHFCNLFNRDKNTHYTAYQAKGSLQNENITVWFLWVYRELEKLINEKDSFEAQVVRFTANAIEASLKNEECPSGGISTPFKHVFSPTALVTSSTNEGKLTKSLKELFNAMVKQHDYQIPEFQRLAEMPQGNCVSFTDWVEKLSDAYTLMKDNDNKEEAALLFLPIIDKAIELLTKKQRRPANFIPLPVHQAHLRQYTDKDRSDIVKLLKGMKIYKDYFSKLMEK